MKIDKDDPKLTAYALGELPEPERSVIAHAVAASPEAQAYVAETQQLARTLRGEFQQELQEAGRKQLNIMPLPETRAGWPETRWSSLAIAAVLAIGVLVAAVVISGLRESDPQRRVAKRDNKPPLQMEFDLASEGAVVTALVPDAEEAFTPVAANPVSRFPLAVGTSGYADVQREIEAGARPRPGTVRIEEMINHFAYDYAEPQADETFSVTLEAATCPWEPTHFLVRVAVKAKAGSPGSIVAQRAGIEVAFDSRRVASYRLVGYRGTGNRSPAGASGFATDIPAGHTTAAFYEVAPAPEPRNAETLLVARVTHLPLGAGSGETTERSLDGEIVPFDQAPTDFRFAAAVAQFGMMLRTPAAREDATLAAVQEWARNALGADASGERARFVELVERTHALAF